MTQLLADVDTIQNELNRLKLSSAGDDPWARRRTTESAERRDVREGMAPAADEPSPGETSRGSHSNTDRQWPLKMAGLLGAITFKDRTVFDDKVMLASEYQ